MANKVKIHGFWGLVAKWFKKSQPPQPKLPILPNDIIYGILLLLPAKSLARSRCVCREWNNLLTGLDFLKRHLDHCHHRLVVSSESSFNYHMYSMDLEAPGSFVLTKLDFPWKKRLHMIMGSCNGLLCMLVGNNLFLWNPSTRKYKQLPPHSCCLKDDPFYGFGYDTSVDGYYNYKVVRGESFNIIEHGIRRSKLVEVYTRKTNSWRRIQDFPYQNVFGRRGIFVNGFLLWLAIRESDKGSWSTIASLDLAKEEFREVMLPDFGQRSLLLDLGVLNGMLCVMCSNTGGWDVYAMKEYGVPESWFVLVTIPSFVWTEDMPSALASIRMPLYLMKNGELVMQISENKMVICDPRYGTNRNHIHTNFTIHSVTYVETLESP